MNVTPLLMLVVLALAFFLMVLRPAKARQKAVQQVQGRLAVGQRVMTTAGLFGYVRDIDTAEVGLEISDGVVVRYVREAIAKVVDDVEDAILTPALTDAVADVTTATAVSDTTSKN